MKKNSIWMLIVLFICGAMTVMTSCSKDDENQSNNEVENTLEETQSINKVIESVKAHLAEVDFQDLALLNSAIRDSLTMVYCVDHDSIGINKAIVDLRILLDCFFANPKNNNGSGKSWKLDDLSTTLKFAEDACIGFERTANKKYIGENKYAQSLFIEINDTLNYKISFSVEKEAGVSLTEVGHDAKRTLTIEKNDTTLLSIVNNRDFDLGLKGNHVNVSKKTLGSLGYKQMNFSIDRAWYNTDSIVSNLKFTKDQIDMLSIRLKGESNLNLENLLSHDVLLKGELEANLLSGLFGVRSKVNDMSKFLVAGIKLSEIGVKGTTKEKCQERTDAFNAVVNSNYLSLGSEVGTITVEPVIADSTLNTYRPDIVIQSLMINDGEKVTIKEALESLGFTFEGLLENLVE